MSFDFCQIIPFLWNYDHFSFQEVIEFLVGKDAVLGKSWNAISSLATFAGASSVILLKLHWSAAETLHTTKRGPLKCSRRYMATKRPVFWFFFHNLPKKLENLLLFSSSQYITCISCSIWVFTLKETFRHKTHFTVLLHFEVRSHYNKIENQEGGKNWMWGLCLEFFS